MALNSAVSYTENKRHLSARIGLGVLCMVVIGTVEMALCNAFLRVRFSLCYSSIYLVS